MPAKLRVSHLKLGKKIKIKKDRIRYSEATDRKADAEATWYKSQQTPVLPEELGHQVAVIAQVDFR